MTAVVRSVHLMLPIIVVHLLRRTVYQVCVFEQFVSGAAMLVMLGIELDGTVASNRQGSWIGTITRVSDSSFGGSWWTVTTFARHCVCLSAAAAVILGLGAV